MNKKDRLGEKDMANKETDRMVSGTLLPGEQQDEYSLRPKRLAEFIGQQKVKDNLSISIQAARARGEVLDHVPALWASRVGQNDAGVNPCQ